jgi:hypothetical protein
VEGGFCTWVCHHFSSIAITNSWLILSRSCHIFYDKRCIDIPDGKTKWSGMDEESDLLDDYGNKKSKWAYMLHISICVYWGYS